MRIKHYLMNMLRSFPDISYHNSFVVYTLFMVLWFWPFLFGGQVIAADFELTVNNNLKMTLTKNDIPYVTRNTVPDPVRHSDYAGLYIPDVYQSIKNDSYHWINTWVADYGFGVPLIHLQSGLSPVYFPTYVASMFTDNPYVLSTWMHMCFNFIAGFVFVAYMKLLRIHPLASLLGGITYATLPLFTYWATQNPFKLHAVWFIVLVYLLQMLITNQRWWWIFLLTISVQSTVLTVYFQSQIFLYTILMCFVLYILFFRIATISQRLRYVFIVGFAGFFGVLMSVPVLLDLMHGVSEGLRVPLPANQIFRVPIEEPHIVLGYFVPEVFSVVPVPVARSNIYNYYVLGYYITMVITLFSFYAVFTQGRKFVLFLSGLFVIILISFEPTLGYLYNKYLSVGVSSWATMFSFFGPIMLVILCTFGINHLINSWHTRRKVGFELAIAVLITAIVIDVYVRTGMEIGWVPRWVTIILQITVLLIVLLSSLKQIDIRIRSAMFVGAILWATISGTFLAVPRMPIDDLSIIGEELKYVKQNLGLDEYVTTVSTLNFDQMGWKCCLFLGNQNVIYDIRGIGVNTLLPQKRYQKLMEKFGYESGSYDRLYKYKHYYSITPNYDSLDYWMMNIGVVVTKEKQIHPSLTYLTTIDNWHIYDADAKGCCLQLPLEQLSLLGTTPAEIEAVHIDPRGKSLYLQKDTRYTDYFEIPLKIGQPSLVIISQQYHKEWDAYALVDNQWQVIDTFAMNGIYQGAITPKGATRVRFDFKPWTLLMWIPHIVWLVGLVAVAIDVRYPNILPSMRRLTHQQ